MTASEETGPAERTAERDAAAGTGLSPQATTAGAGQDTEPLTGSIAAPDDPRQLERKIERTREQLGQTVQELAARTDVKSMARTKAAAATERVKSTTVQARKNAAARAGSVRSQVAGQAGRARNQWVPLAAAAAVLVVGYLAFRQWGRRQSSALSDG